MNNGVGFPSESPEETNPANIFISDLQTPELREKMLLLL